MNDFKIGDTVCHKSAPRLIMVIYMIDGVNIKCRYYNEKDNTWTKQDFLAFELIPEKPTK